MTTQELINYYANLLIFQYLGSPKAYATIQTFVEGSVMPQSDITLPTLPLAVQDAYDLIGENPAVGVQLDVLGKYAGVTRTGAGVSGQVITLDDADFLTFIQVAIISNNSGSSLYDIATNLYAFFGTEIYVVDSANMKLTYYISSLASTDLIQLFITEKLLPAPMGVQVAVIIFAPIVNAFFGFVTYDNPMQPAVTRPFNDYDDYHTDWPFFSYSDVLV